MLLGLPVKQNSSQAPGPNQFSLERPDWKSPAQAFLALWGHRSQPALISGCGPPKRCINNNHIHIPGAVFPSQPTSPCSSAPHATSQPRNGINQGFDFKASFFFLFFFFFPFLLVLLRPSAKFPLSLKIRISPYPCSWAFI